MPVLDVICVLAKWIEIDAVWAFADDISTSSCFFKTLIKKQSVDIKSSIRSVRCFNSWRGVVIFGASQIFGSFRRFRRFRHTLGR